MDVKEKEIHLKDYLRVILKRKKLVILFFLITIITVVMGSSKSTPLYKASVKLKVEKNESDPLSGHFRYSGYDPEFLQTQSEIISSKAVAEKVVEYLNLVDTYSSFFPKKEQESFSLSSYIKKYIKTFIKTVIKKNEKPPEETASGENLKRVYFENDNSPGSIMADTVRGGIMVAPVQQSKIVNVSYVSASPVFSALVANNIAKAYIERILEMRMENISYTLEWMKKKAAEERKKLEDSEIRLQQYLKKKEIVTIENRIAIIPQRLSQISADLTRAESEKEKLGSVISLIDKTPAKFLETIPVVATNKTFQEIRKRVLMKEQEILELSQKYGPKHPVIKRLKTEVKTLEFNKENEIANIIQEVRNDYQLALSNEKNLRDQLRKTKNEASRLNEEFVQYNIFQREVETNKQLYQALVSRIKEQTITKQTRNVDVWVIEKAKVPLGPFNQNAKRNILLGIVLGLFGGVGLAFFLEYLDNRVSMAEDAEEKTGLPCIGVVGFIKGEDVHKHKIVADSPLSADSEAYKSIRASLMLSSPTGFPSSILVTSSSSGEGKTMTSTNLAIACALSDKKVLLVDADMRKPKLHKLFNLSNEKGFSGILSGEDYKSGYIQKPEIENLFIITAGKKPVNPSELLSSDKLDNIINTFAKNFDVVIFDTPPAGVVSDSIVLGKKVEKIILVSRSAYTKYENIQSCIKKMGGLESKIVGQIVNAVDMKKQGYYQNYYYSEYYA